MIASSLFLFFRLDVRPQADVILYRSIAEDLSDGILPYRDRIVEYPPYAIFLFVLPRICGHSNYLEGFLLLGVLADWILKYLLYSESLRYTKSSRALLPLTFYCVGICSMQSFFLQRYDIWPTLLSFLAMRKFLNGKHALSGFLLGMAVGVKFYPIVLVLPLCALSIRQHKGLRFCVGLAIAALPTIVLSMFLPWWRFAEFQSNRGLQVESFYASILWLGKLLGITELDWSWVRAWYEVTGPAAAAFLPVVRVIFIMALIFSTLVTVLSAVNRYKPLVPSLARLLLIPLLGFVAFSPILSPQYLIWILPFAALGTLEFKSWKLLLPLLAIALTPIFYPSPQYYSGLSLTQTVALLTRNLVLIASWLYLIRDVFPWRKLKEPTAR